MPLEKYFMSSEKVRTAREKCEKASAQLDLALVSERMAELESQHQPIAGLLEAAGVETHSDEYEKLRKLVNKAVFYVVIGRFPS